ncbi:hypothetical protein IGB42_00499 [Andreprevotia sp. IGB-42]|uniref:4'-phosphopantetheinyl transferase family protein n=1 Tax=Andreprevotia sp. IGB-42 TaxID=2497473 RepID=UPI00135C8587|nr:4'-phosphopantetheinyl transferase superfamily protein [Andreprevotia sp. IGB-42]KAF0815418.1 hypothetical protein IGB42_00499 [Andreprevotia sp. IGB-42]
MPQLEILLFDTRNASAAALSPQALSASTLQRLSAIQSTHRARQIVLGRRLLAVAAGRMLGTAVAARDIKEGDAGYPLINGHGMVFANLSHSGPWLAAIACRDWQPGLDIEVARPRNVLALAERAFDADDAALVCNADPAHGMQLFHAAWTLREAAYKAGLRSSVVGTPAVLDSSGGPAAGLRGQLLQHTWQDGDALRQLHLAVVAPRPFSVSLCLIDQLETV